MAIQGALFDMDGLLLDTERLGMRAFQDVLLQFGMTEDRAESLYLTLVGGTRAGTIQALSDAFPDHDGLDLHDRWRARLGELLNAGVPLRPTVRDVLSRLSDAGITMAVVTSTQRADAQHHLEKAGILPYFSRLIGGDDVTKGKPDPEPYRRGAAVLGVSPEQCVAFEDSDTGTAAAVAAGCQTWQIPDLRPAGREIPQLGQGIANTLLEAASASVLVRA